jgi:flagellar biosynthesis GTPase FlhF
VFFQQRQQRLNDGVVFVSQLVSNGRCVHRDQPQFNDVGRGGLQNELFGVSMVVHLENRRTAERKQRESREKAERKQREKANAERKQRERKKAERESREKTGREREQTKIEKDPYVSWCQVIRVHSDAYQHRQSTSSQGGHFVFDGRGQRLHQPAGESTRGGVLEWYTVPVACCQGRHLLLDVEV